MTKKTNTVDELDAVLNPVQTDEDKAYDRARQEQRDKEWLREYALSHAISFHKNNGGMLTAPQLVEHANVFLNFIKGEAQ
jgi:hypothetical protein